MLVTLYRASELLNSLGIEMLSFETARLLVLFAAKRADDLHALTVTLMSVTLTKGADV